MGDSSLSNTQRPRSKFKKNIAIVLLLAVVCFGSGYVGGYVAYQQKSQPTLISHGAPGDGNAITTEHEQSISSVSDKVGQSVVSITTTQKIQSTFFGSQLAQGVGSGIIITKDGYVLTNKHVVSGSDTVSVTMSDGTTYEDAKVIGSDPLNDIAFVKIPGVKNLKPAELGDSSTVRIGQNVVAIGNSLGEFQNTVTSGIISGTGRPISAKGSGKIETLTDLLQTDAAINPGNSGGPLVNLSGQVIGINTAIAEDAQSVGFAIPINAAKGIIKNLKKTGKVERAYLGVSYISISPEVVKKYKLPVKEGAFVFNDAGDAVVNESPAANAGIKARDIITKVGDLKVGEKGNLSSLLSEYATGDTVQLTLLRNGEERTVNVKLETYRN